MAVVYNSSIGKPTFPYRPDGIARRSRERPRPTLYRESEVMEIEEMSKLSKPIDTGELEKKAVSKPLKKTTVIETYDGPELNTHSLAYFLPQYVKEHLTASKNNMYNCPYCGSGTGPNGTGAFGIVKENSTRFKCLACNKTGDIFELIGQVEGITNFKDQKKRVFDLYGAGPGGLTATRSTTAEPVIKREAKKKPKVKETMTPEEYEEKRNALEEYFDKCNKRLDETEYHRGISRETLDRFKVGYDPAWKNPKAENGPASPRLIIPTGGLSYIARSTDPNIEKKYRIMDVGSKNIFNVECIVNATKPIFVVEGEIDAMSIIDAGGEAVGLGGVGMNDFIETLIETPPQQPLIIALDNDKPNEDGTPGTGPRMTEGLVAQLNAIKIDYRVVNVYGDVKDANDALNADREALAYKIENVLNLAEKDYIKTKSVAGYMDTYINYLRLGQETIPSGFKKLDERLNGGFPPGLIVLGAVSSLGKTTFLLQVADNMAKAGYDVMYFSLEMSRTEIITKSISRMTYIKSMEKYNGDYMAKDTRTIMRGVRNFNDAEREHFCEALREYEKSAEHMFILEGNDGGDEELNVDGMRSRVDTHITTTGRRPVVFVDYLQILPPAKERMSDNEVVRYNVKALKDLSRDFDIPVFVISSFNRANYKTVSDMESFKQSGGIEYSADLLYSMEFNGTGTKGFCLQDEKKKTPREIILKPLKDRTGDLDYIVPLAYYPKYNYFKEGNFPLRKEEELKEKE